MSETGASSGYTHAEGMVIAACAISMLIVQMDWFALNLALPPIAKDFGVPTTDLQWIISGYMLSIGALMVTAGSAGPSRTLRPRRSWLPSWRAPHRVSP